MINLTSARRSEAAKKARFAFLRYLALALSLSSFAFSQSIPSAVFAAQAREHQHEHTLYVCPMDSDVKSKSPGKCPKCGMTLREASDDTASSATALAGAETAYAEASDKTGESLRPRIPDTVVYDQNGRKLNFYTDLVKGKTVAINFIFTTCTTICPPLTATFRKTQQELGERVGRDVQLISVSVDPTTDVPERLKSFAAKFNAQPGWAFVTGDKLEINELLKSLGAFVGDKTDHSPMALVGNEAAGYWTRTYGLAPAKTLVKVITEAADKKVADEKGADEKTGASAQVPLPGNGSPVAATERQIEKRATAAAASGDVKDETDKAASTVDAAAKYFPNVALLTQDNRQVHFYDDLLKGKTVLINFLFTTCTGVCPPMTANLAKAQEYLGDRVGKDIIMISLSVDPEVDTPGELKKFSDKFKVKPGWYFLTGKKEEIERVLRKLGGYVEDKNQHSGILLVGNVATGEWMKMFAMTKPADIASAVVSIADSNNH